MTMTYKTVSGTVTRPDSNIGIRAKVTVTPLSTNHALTFTGDDRITVGPVVVETASNGVLPALKIPTNVDLPGLVWRITAEAIDPIPGMPKRWTVKNAVSITGTGTALLRDLAEVDVLTVDATVVASVSDYASAADASKTAAAGSATTAAGWADAAASSAADADTSADLADTSADTATTAASTATTKATEASTSATTATTKASEAAASASHAEDMAGAAEAVAVSNDTIIAGRINDPASATATALTASFAGLLDVATTVTASGALAVNKHTPVNATDGNKAMTLANATAKGQYVIVSKTDASANTVTVTANLRGVAGSAYVLTRQYDAVTLLSKSDGSWWPSALHRNKAATDADTTAAVATALAGAQSAAIAPVSGVIALHRDALETNGSPKCTPYSGGGAYLTSGASTGTYAHFGATTTDSTVEAVITHESSYNYPGDPLWGTGGQHVGLCARWVDKDNCPVIAMFSVDDNSVQIAAKNAGAETNILHTTPTTGTFYYGQKVRIKIVVAGTSCTVTWTDDATGTQMHTYTFTLAGSPASGKFAWHTYSATSVMTKATILSSAGAPVAGGYLWVAMNGTDSPNAAGLSAVGKTFVLTTDNSGTGNVNNNWGFPVSPVRMKNGTIRGILNRTSGRIMGLSFRLTDVGAGYYVMYDNNITSLVLKKGITDGIANVGSPVVIGALAAGTDYPFELVVKDNLISFTINGNTVTWADSTYPNAGYVGLVGYQGVHGSKDLAVIPDPF